MSGKADLPPVDEGYVRGHVVVYDEILRQWRYKDTLKLATGRGSVDRECPQCHKIPTAMGYDACLGRIMGANDACCGHGVHLGYIRWNGSERMTCYFKGAWVGEF